MADKKEKTSKTGKTKPRRLSKGWRKHIRRMKQAARKTGTTFTR